MTAGDAVLRAGLIGVLLTVSAWLHATARTGGGTGAVG